MKKEDEKDYDVLSLTVQIFLGSFAITFALPFVLALFCKRDQRELFELANKMIYSSGLFVSMAGLIPLSRGIFKLSKFAFGLVCELLFKKR